MDSGTGSKPSAPKASGRETPTPQAAQLRTTWDRQLDAYVKVQGGTPGSVRSLRAKLADRVRASPESPEAWWALLQQEEALLSNSTATLDRGAGRGGVTLFDLYHAATKVIPRQNNYNNDAFIKLWLGFARQQWVRNQDDARDVFKMLKSQHIGDQHAGLYYEWAALEHIGGSQYKALGVLSKGLKEQAQPSCLLEQMQSELQAGKFMYKAPWTHDGSKTGTASLGAFLTPGALDERRSSATPTVEVSGMGGGATDTLVINRSLPQRPTESGRAIVGAGDTDTVARGGGRAGAAPAASQQQHTAGLTDQLNNRTSHTTHSGSTVGSDDPTATMRMKTPATGLSNHSGSSSGSLSEEATVSLRKPSRMSGGGSAGAGGDDPRAANDDTLVINRSSLLLKTALSHGAPPKEAASGATATIAGAKDHSLQGLLKPRRLGVLGKAQRAVPGSTGRPPLAPAATSEQQLEQQQEHDEAAADANRKRKADMEAAQSPKPLLSVGEGKRRQSPGEEAKAARPAAAGAAGASRLADRQQPPVPRFDEQRPAPSAGLGGSSSKTAAADVVTTAAPHRPPLAAPSMAASRAQPAAPAARPPVPPGGPRAAQQQVVLREGGAASRGGKEDGGGEEDETAPVVMSKLAQRVQRGRQSLAPHKVVLGIDGSLLHRSGTPGPADDDDDAPTMHISRPTAVSTAAAPAAVDDDADATRPLVRAAPSSSKAASPPPPVRPTGPRVQIDGAGNVNVMRPSSAGSKPLPVPPAPPPTMAEAAAAQPRVPMGPPPPKQARPAAAPAAQQPPAARPGRRVVEDENNVVVKDIQYTKLECVGRGGSSKVYKVMAPNRKIFALKRIRLQGRDAEAASGFLDEIKLLNCLAGRSNIIQLIDSEVHRSEGLIYMVLEFGDIDLARLLQKHEKSRREKAGGQVEEIDENFIRLYWEQMLQAVDDIHRERIVHSDLKPANFLMVEGQLKLIDFGIAKAIQSDTTSIARESQVGTLNYMSPEAILGGQNNIRGGPPMKVGRASDIWSLGCILYQMVYGQTPFSHLPFIQKMHAIIDTNHRVSFPPLQNAALVDVIQRCLDRNPRTRIGMQELLEHPFLRPTNAPAAAAPAAAKGSSVELSREQLTKLLHQVAQAGVSGSTNVGQMSEQLFKQLASGLSPDLVSRKASSAIAAAQARVAQARAPPAASAHAAAAAPPQPSSSSMPPPRPPPQQRQTASVADAAAQAASARASQRAVAVAALESRPRAAGGGGGGAAAAAGGSGRAALMPISQSAIVQQAAALRKVDPAQQQPAARRPESGLEAALRKGLERFKFEDATGGEDGNTTGGFSDV